MDIKGLIEHLYEIGSIRLGDFTLKSGLKSPIYFDMRLLISHPKLLKLTSDLMRGLIEKENLDFDIMCGVPYGAIPISTALSIIMDKPMILKRKDGKQYGTKKMVEGCFKPKDRCIVIEDVVTSGGSIFETIESLKEQEIDVNDVVVILDRCQGAKQRIEKHGMRFHSLTNSFDVLNTLLESKKISKEIYDNTLEFLSKNNFASEQPENNVNKINDNEVKEFDFETRGKLAKNPLAKNLFSIMSNKKSNLCIAADITDIEELLKIADNLGPYICILKTHVDIITNFSLEKMKKLYDIAAQHQFLIFEDRKFADIGNTVKLQYTSGIYKISEWAHIINAHSIVGSGIIQGLHEGIKKADFKDDRACLLIAELSTKGNLITPEYVVGSRGTFKHVFQLFILFYVSYTNEETVSMAEMNSDFIIGFICQSKVSKDPGLLHMTPGVQLNKASDGLGQQYITPEKAIYENKCDIVIVGRGILHAEDQIKAALNYKNLAYNAYLKRLESSI